MDITGFERLTNCSLDELHRTLRYRVGAALECAFVISSPKHNDPPGCFEYKQIRKQLEKNDEQLDRIEKLQKMK